ncbi:MAG: hypothetical protein VKK94_05295 [Cyanobacteriota bacterium]|nr:hypothetical protein [Cyanobacteriota bacterium]
MSFAPGALVASPQGLTAGDGGHAAGMAALQASTPQVYAHPYYWARFILIGNGL